MAANDIAVSCHAPYYINLCNPDDAEVVKSFGYIKKSVRAINLMGGKRVVFHTGYFGKLGTDDAVKLAAERLRVLIAHLDETGAGDFILCPEAMGKPSQLGTYRQVIELCKIDERLIPAYDFGHINSLTGGGLRGYGDYKEIFDYTIGHLGRGKTEKLHIHFSKIQYGAKGEIRHLDFTDEKYGPDFEPLMQVLSDYRLLPRVICESSENMAEDALQMKRYYDKISNTERR